MAKKHLALGLMSGTSLDGLDLCLCQFSEDDTGWQFEILAAETMAYDQYWHDQLLHTPELSGAALTALNVSYGEYLGKAAKNFLQKHPQYRVEVLGSHGHTVFHQPELGYTLQIGDGRQLAAVCGYPVVYDFRPQDICLGGQGAPLVPIGDELLFSGYDACLNLGGFANISFKKNCLRRGFDICPLNIVLNAQAAKTGRKYDDQGLLSSAGIVCTDVLQILDALPFYGNGGAKSLGKEWVEAHIMPVLESLPIADALATFTEHAAGQISRVLRTEGIRKVLLTGGGTYNQFFVGLLRQKLAAESTLVIPHRDIIEFKEALIFAFMAVLRVTGRNNVLSSVTGASQDHSSGLVVVPPSYAP